MAGSILGFSLPTFWVGLMLIMVFAVLLGWLPSTGRGPTTERSRPRRLSIFTAGRPALRAAAGAQPRAVQALADHPADARAGARAGLLDYIKFARAKGLPRCARASACTC